MITEQELEKRLSSPSTALVEDFKELDGDVIVLGIGGKMGPSLGQLARAATDAAQVPRRIIGVSRFSDRQAAARLEAAGIETIACDLADEHQLHLLPDAANVIYMVGTKFGTTGQEDRTWGVNAYLSGRIADRFRGSRIVAFSTGNVYPLTRVDTGGSTEDDAVGPVGEYAQSCLGRERVLQYHSRLNGTPMALVRLNYATDLRYGVLVDLAMAVRAGTPIGLRTGHVNVVWQGYANEVALRLLRTCASPPRVVNVAGPETVPVRWLAQELGRRMGTEPVFADGKPDTALLSNATLAHQEFGYPDVTLGELLDWTVQWLETDQPMLGKPTHFQEREGRY